MTELPSEYIRHLKKRESTIKKYSNDSLLDHITKSQNIPILEEILDREVSRIKQLHENKRQPGKRLSKKELQATLEEVKPYVDEFLGVSPEMVPPCKVSYPSILKKNYYAMFKSANMRNPIKTPLKISASLFTIATTSSLVLGLDSSLIPTLGVCSAIPLMIQVLLNDFHTHYEPYRGFYTFSEKSISTTRVKRTLMIPVLTHEYTHHLLYMLSVESRFPKLGSLQEGLAMGAQKHTAQIYKEKEDNDSFEYYDLNHTLLTLINTYSYLCQKFGTQSKKNLTLGLPSKELDSHDIGNTYFRIEAENKGETVYRDALHEFAFLKEAPQ